MDTSIDKELVNGCMKSKVWDLGNKVLYDLCSTHFTHDTEEKILAKVWLIGRAYAVAIERRRNKKDINDSFYIDHVAPAFKNSELDLKLSALRTNRLTINSLKQSLEVHGYLTRHLCDLTNLEKRSFSSKYLHFHLPHLFYIYDSRAVGALRRFVRRVPKELESWVYSEGIDKDYAKFACKCFLLQQTIHQQTGIQLSTRQLDNLLVEVANNRLKAKSIAGIKTAAHSIRATN
jgi:hypothetical protein